jgi:hypothetical protein
MYFNLKLYKDILIHIYLSIISKKLSSSLLKTTSPSQHGFLSKYPIFTNY